MKQNRSLNHTNTTTVEEVDDNEIIDIVEDEEVDTEMDSDQEHENDRRDSIFQGIFDHLPEDDVDAE